MKRIPIILFFLVLAPAASAQRSIDEVLRQVENASRELEAQRQLTAAQKQDAATGKYMANPTVEMEKMWGAAGGGQNTELAVVQTIDFPTVYGSRNRIAKLKGSLYEKQWESQRQQLLLQVKQLCIEIVYLYRQRGPARRTVIERRATERSVQTKNGDGRRDLPRSEQDRRRVDLGPYGRRSEPS